MKPRRYRLMMCASVALLAVGLLTLALGIVQGASVLTRITTATPQGGNSPANSRQSHFPVLSANGTKIAFASDSDFLNQGIITGQFQICLYDTSTLTFTRVTTGSDDFGYDLSADGQKVVLEIGPEIWLYNVPTAAFTRVTTASSNDRSSFLPRLSADGTKIAFVSDSDFLNQGVPNDQNEIWLYNTTTMTVTRITTASGGDRDSGSSDIIGGLDPSADGTKIAFASDSDFLGQGIPNDQYEIWLYNTATLTVTRITTASANFRDSHFPSINANSTRIAFVSNSDFLGQGISDNQLEIWLYDTATLNLTRVTTASASDRTSFHPNLNTDGTKLAFMSNSDMLGQGITKVQSEIWLYDTATMTVTRITSGTQASEAPSISADGKRIAFHSYSNFLEQGTLEWQAEIWLYQVLEKQYYLPVIFKK